MPEQGELSPLEILQKIPFSIVAMVELMTNEGSYERDAAMRICHDIKNDIEQIAVEFKALALREHLISVSEGK